MELNLLLTKELKASMPSTIEIVINFGEIRVVFPDENNQIHIEDDMIGDNAVVRGETEEIVKWLKPFDGVAVGVGSPQMEKFEIKHIKV